MGTQALVIGNGESRRCINLQQAAANCVVVGCNAVHRDLVVDHLVCCDERMAREAVDNPNTVNTVIHVRPQAYQYLRKIRKNKNVTLLPDLPYQGDTRPDKAIHWGSGAYAVLIAAQLNVSKCNLIGFDLYGRNDRVNNIYKDTTNYSAAQSHAVDPSYWIYQIGKIFSAFPQIEFAVFNTEQWTMPAQWQHSNVNNCVIGVDYQVNTLYN